MTLAAKMKVLLLLTAWYVHFVLSWPITLIALIAAPIVWFFSLPLRLIGVCVESILALLRAVLIYRPPCSAIADETQYRNEDLAEPGT
jgi:hypothetical protein